MLLLGQANTPCPPTAIKCNHATHENARKYAKLQEALVTASVVLAAAEQGSKHATAEWKAERDVYTSSERPNFAALLAKALTAGKLWRAARTARDNHKQLELEKRIHDHLHRCQAHVDSHRRTDIRRCPHLLVPLQNPIEDIDKVPCPPCAPHQCTSCSQLSSHSAPLRSLCTSGNAGLGALHTLARGNQPQPSDS